MDAHRDETEEECERQWDEYAEDSKNSAVTEVRIRVVCVGDKQVGQSRHAENDEGAQSGTNPHEEGAFRYVCHALV